MRNFIFLTVEKNSQNKNIKSIVHNFGIKYLFFLTSHFFYESMQTKSTITLSLQVRKLKGTCSKGYRNKIDTKDEFINKKSPLTEHKNKNLGALDIAKDLYILTTQLHHFIIIAKKKNKQLLLNR